MTTSGQQVNGFVESLLGAVRTRVMLRTALRSGAIGVSVAAGSHEEPALSTLALRHLRAPNSYPSESP